MSERYRAYLVDVDFREGNVIVTEVEYPEAQTIRALSPAVNENAGADNVVEAAKSALGSIMPEDYTPDEPFGKGPSDHPADDELED